MRRYRAKAPGMIFESGEERPSRALNIAVKVETVVEECTKKNRDISAIEPLPGGGTRVVMRTVEDAASLRRRFAKSLIKEPVERTAYASHRGY